jgi:hypothetical protein
MKFLLLTYIFYPYCLHLIEEGDIYLAFPSNEGRTLWLAEWLDRGLAVQKEGEHEGKHVKKLFYLHFASWKHYF